MIKQVVALLLVPLLVLTMARSPALAQVPPAAPDDQAWPREFQSASTTFTVYQPQIESWKGRDLSGRAAVSVKDAISPEEQFGVIWFTANTNVNRTENLVTLDDITITRANFPATPDKADQYLQALRGSAPRQMVDLSLNHLRAEIAVAQAESAPQKPVAVKNDVPKIYFSSQPAMLVQVDGEPVLRQVQGYELLRVINTYAVILFNQSQGTYYLHAVGKWAQAQSIEGPWTVAAQPPASLNKILTTLTKGGQVNALDNPGQYVAQSAASGIFPTIYVSTVPAELIMTRGAPSYEPISGTSLLDVTNTDDNLIVDPANDLTYVPISGRWFQTASLSAGSWTYVPNDKLPADFAKIPVTHPRGVVLASVTGTPQAQEAIIDNNIPQTAVVTRATTTLTVKYGGSPQIQGIDGTPLQYVVNSPYPVIRVDAASWYALKDGVWFAGTSVNGPWAVAASVSEVIYTIPPSSPLHYVTYAYVFGSTPQTVTVGYTPGYYGTVLAPTGTVVYGTGYVYPPVYWGSFWYPPPVTYGFGTGFFWGSVTGFAFGAAAGAVWGGAWGHWGGYASYTNVNINNFNSYNHWSSNQVRTNVQRDYNQQTGRLTQQQRQQAQRDYNRRTGQLTSQQRSNLQNRASQRPNDTFAGKDGNAYKRGADGGWQQHSSGGWNKAGFSDGRESASGLDRQQQPGAMATGPTTCTGHGAASAAMTPASGAWAAGTAASMASMDLEAAVCLAVIASAVVALAGGGLVEAGSAASAAAGSGARAQTNSTNKRSHRGGAEGAKNKKFEARNPKFETISNKFPSDSVFWIFPIWDLFVLSLFRISSFGFRILISCMIEKQTNKRR